MYNNVWCIIILQKLRYLLHSGVHNNFYDAFPLVLFRVWAMYIGQSLPQLQEK